MPTTYTHYVFGQECFSVLDEPIKKIVAKNRYLYDIGVHGPDIFFYYHALKKNEVSEYGNQLHYVPATPLFENAKKVYNQYQDNKDAMLAYLLGLLSHYTLDSSAHGYIEKKIEVSGVSHNKIEAEYDAHLMRLRGLQPMKVDRSSTLHPSPFIAEIISRFYPFDQNTLLEAITSQKKILHLLYSPTGGKKTTLLWAMKKFHIQNDFSSLFINNEELEACKDSNLRLDKIRLASIEKFKILSDNFLAYLKDEEDLSAYFEHDFNYDPNTYPLIPVLSYEEELKHTIKGEEYGEIKK